MKKLSQAAAELKKKVIIKKKPCTFVWVKQFA